MTLKTIREGKFAKVIASYLAIQMFLQMVQPITLFALTSGPTQPEFNSFTPIGTSDMVNLSSGDFNYNIPVMDVGGYPLNLAYDAGVTMDQEASWVGLGWNMNVGQINRQVRGLPDDFKGDEMVYEHNMRDNVTVGTTVNVNPAILGFEPNLGGAGFSAGIGLSLRYNNYTGVSWQPSLGITFELTDNVSLGADFSNSATDGFNITPNANLGVSSKGLDSKVVNGVSGGLGIGTTFNSRQGFSNLTTNADFKAVQTRATKDFGQGFNTAGGARAAGSNLSLLNRTYTPNKRMPLTNHSFTFSFSLGGAVWGLDAEVGLTGFGTIQSVKDKRISAKAFGYDFGDDAGKFDITDKNRENERTISKNTTVLPVTIATHDLYSINGQGIGGMFRPFRSQVGFTFDRLIKDRSLSNESGGEVEVGSGSHIGADLRLTGVNSSTGLWTTDATDVLQEPNEKPSIGYQKSYFKMVGDMTVDKESELFNTKLQGDQPIAFNISTTPYHRQARRSFSVKTSPTTSIDATVNNNLRRTVRETPNQSIQKINKVEGLRDPMIDNERLSPLSRDHHTVGMKIMKEDGSTYVYGESAYNVQKQELTFATDNLGDCTTGIVGYREGEDRVNRNDAGQDAFFNRIITPAYAHTYLLSSVLSADYEDITGDGPSLDDLGAYTKFTYKDYRNYRWRLPYGLREANYDEGLKTLKDDQKGNYLYGEKELKYIQKIETKTHVAFFELSPRKDAVGVVDHNGGGGAGAANMYQLDKVFLFSRPEYLSFQSDLEDDDPNNDPLYEDLAKAAIKIAHFEYDYSLCTGVPNNNQEFYDGNGDGINDNFLGKLTLKRVFFTYRGSEMGRFTPYQFNYDGLNVPYNIKSYDVWGNYKPNQTGTAGCGVTGEITAPEFPFVQQEDKALQDSYATAWSLTSIDLPSGGRLNVDYESDDYQYVQDKKAMQMFKVAGVSRKKEANLPLGDEGTKLYGYSDFDPQTEIDDFAKYLILEIPEASGFGSGDNSAIEIADFKERYLGEHLNEPIFFRFLLNMNKRSGNNNPDFNRNEMDYVEGYFRIQDDLSENSFFEENGKMYVNLGVIPSNLEGGIASSSDKINPITKAGWFFGRKYLNQTVYTGNINPSSNQPVQIAKDLVNSFNVIRDIIAGPNGILKSRRIARRFMPDKSWIRLQHPSTAKLGGGCRVKQIRLDDHWDIMVDKGTEQAPNTTYRSEYGQEYDYQLADNKGSSGVATYEPNNSKENPLVMPFYDGESGSDRLSAPKEVSYSETPFGASFYPAPMVTYSRVIVKNLERQRDVVTGSETTTQTMRKHATGTVVNEFYTCKDFPTKADFTVVDNKNNYDSNENEFLESFAQSVLKIDAKNQLTLAQGFVVETNDMNGKQKGQSVFDENGSEISAVSYRYHTEAGDVTSLSNKLPVIFNDGRVEDTHDIGMHYEVVNDFRRARTTTETVGAHLNVAVLPTTVPPIPLVFLDRAKHDNTMQMATTTKVIHRSGIMVEKIARDLGAQVSTKNLAWDAETGQVLLTETVNEYDDHYFNMTYPVHWMFKGMNKATLNVGIEGQIIPPAPGTTGVRPFTMEGVTDLRSVFFEGDEIEVLNVVNGHYWVVGFTNDYSGVYLMNRDGEPVNYCGNESRSFYDFKIVRSGYRNQQMGAMASVTSLTNPIDNNGSLQNLSTTTFEYTTSGTNKKVVNASAVGYTDYWKPQPEYQIPRIKEVFPDPAVVTSSYTVEGTPTNFDPTQLSFNPYLYNVRGEWRAIKSYAYLTGRNVSATGVQTRTEGFFDQFLPLYRLNGTDWELNTAALDVNQEQHWTFASEVSQYSPYGAELENRDALDRYSAAQYGYNYTLPMAVASNSEYKEIGFDGFEDYAYSEEALPNATGERNPHFSFIDQTAQLDGPMRSSLEAHTGRYSLRVSGGSSITKGVTLGPCLVEDPPEPDCNVEDPVGISIDGSPGPVCDNTETRTITLIGAPGTTVNYTTTLVPIGGGNGTYNLIGLDNNGVITIGPSGTTVITFSVEVIGNPAISANLILDFTGQQETFEIGPLCTDS